MIARGIAALGPKGVAGIFAKVKEFSEFNEDNDPWNEHDFGSFLYESQEPFQKRNENGFVNNEARGYHNPARDITRDLQRLRGKPCNTAYQ